MIQKLLAWMFAWLPRRRDKIPLELQEAMHSEEDHEFVFFDPQTGKITGGGPSIRKFLGH